MLMSHIINAATTNGIHIPVDMTEETAAEIFHKSVQLLPMKLSTRKRRHAELALSTTLRLVREEIKDREIIG
jgi:hypothetical protein